MYHFTGQYPSKKTQLLSGHGQIRCFPMIKGLKRIYIKRLIELVEYIMEPSKKSIKVPSPRLQGKQGHNEERQIKI